MWSKSSLMLSALVVGNACAIERPNPSIEDRVAKAELIVVVEDVKPLPRTPKEFDKFYRVEARVAGVLKGKADIGTHIEIVVNNTISEHRNMCCTTGQAYVLFLHQHDGAYVFVGSPNGAIPLDLTANK